MSELAESENTVTAVRSSHSMRNIHGDSSVGRALCHFSNYVDVSFDTIPLSERWSKDGRSSRSPRAKIINRPENQCVRKRIPQLFEICYNVEANIPERLESFTDIRRKQRNGWQNKTDQQRCRLKAVSKSFMTNKIINDLNLFYKAEGEGRRKIRQMLTVIP